MSPDFYIDMSRALERAGFDYLMFEDGSFVPDSYGSSPDWFLRHASAQRRPVICQAGGSPAGKAFGAAMRRYRDDITDRAQAAGRDPKCIKILYSVSPIVDADADAAAERAAAAVDS